MSPHVLTRNRNLHRDLCGYRLSLIIRGIPICILQSEIENTADDPSSLVFQGNALGKIRSSEVSGTTMRSSMTPLLIKLI